MNKATKITLIVISSVLALIFVAMAGFAILQRVKHTSFYKDAHKAFKIPGLWGGSVPQGFEYLPGIETFLYTGYHKDGESPSMVYIMPENGKGEAREVLLYEQDGTTPFNGHVGGITVFEDYAYIADGFGVAVFSIFDILDSDGEATQLGEIENEFQVAFVEVYNGFLYVGNFYRAGDYETPKSHHRETPNGDQNTAMIYAYELNETSGYPARTVPSFVFSITDAIQGMAFGDNGEIFLSSSWGLSTSKIYVYDSNKLSYSLERLESGQLVELAYLDSGCLIEVIEAPPMAEELVYHDGELYIMSESASMKYLFGKLTNGAWCYAYEYEAREAE